MLQARDQTALSLPNWGLGVAKIPFFEDDRNENNDSNNNSNPSANNNINNSNNYRNSNNSNKYNNNHDDRLALSSRAQILGLQPIGPRLHLGGYQFWDPKLDTRYLHSPLCLRNPT